MRKLSDTTGFVGYGETSWDSGYSSETSSQALIVKANSVPLIRIFKHYGLHIGEYSKITICPFRSHKGGHESTPSFNFFPQTNSFCCFGCKKGSRKAHGCEFISAMDGISRLQAAHKILSLFKDYIGDYDGEYDDFYNSPEMLEIMLDFSNIVRDFRDTYLDDKSQKFIERICRLYDELYARHNTNGKGFEKEALLRMVERLKETINNYKLCLIP